MDEFAINEKMLEKNNKREKAAQNVFDEAIEVTQKALEKSMAEESLNVKPENKKVNKSIFDEKLKKKILITIATLAIAGTVGYYTSKPVIDYASAMSFAKNDMQQNSSFSLDDNGELNFANNADIKNAILEMKNRYNIDQNEAMLLIANVAGSDDLTLAVQAEGYPDINSYLARNGYVQAEGHPDFAVFRNYNENGLAEHILDYKESHKERGK